MGELWSLVIGVSALPATNNAGDTLTGPKAQLCDVHVLLGMPYCSVDIFNRTWSTDFHVPKIRYYTIFLLAFDVLQIHTFIIPGVATNTMYVARLFIDLCFV